VGTIAMTILQNIKYNARRLRRPRIILGFILLIILAVLVIAPFLSLINSTLTLHLTDSYRIPGAHTGEFTLRYWEDIISRWRILIRPLFNSIIVGLGTSLVAVIVGLGFAWLVIRTDIPGKFLLTALAVIPYMLPSWAFVFPWVEFFKNNGINMPAGFLEFYTGIRVPIWLVYGPIPIIVIMGVTYSPFVYILVSNALKNVDARLEETGELLGASRWKILRTITFPSVLPAILGATLLAFSRTIGSFGTPALLGNPVHYDVLAVQIRSYMQMQMPPRAYIIALLLIIITFFTLYINDRLIGIRKGFDVIGGKGVRKRLISLGRYGRPIFWLFFGTMGLFIIGSLILLFWTSFMHYDGDYSLNNFTLNYWIGHPNPLFAKGEPGILRNPRIWISTLNSLRVALIGGLICAILATFIGYVAVRTRGSKLASTLEGLSFIPMLVPSVAFGAIYLTLFSVSRGPIPGLYGTFALLYLVTVGKRLPYASRMAIASMHQVAEELEESAEVTGDSWPSRFRKIVWPLIRSGFISGMLISFISTMRGLSLYILLISPRTQLLTVLIFEYAEIGNRQISNAGMSYLIILIFAITGLIKFIESRLEKQPTRKQAILKDN